MPNHSPSSNLERKKYVVSQARLSACESLAHETKKYDAWSTRTGLLCCLPSDVPLIDKQRLKKCPELGPLTLHTRTVPCATTVVVCWLLPPEQSQLVSHHAGADMWEIYHIRKCTWYHDQWRMARRGEANLIRRLGSYEHGNEATNALQQHRSVSVHNSWQT